MKLIKRMLLQCILFGGSAWAQISTTQYYDNRKAAVVWTVDDLLGDRGPKFWAAAELARTNGVVISIGIVTSSMNSQLWAEMQAQMDRGYVEPMNHSYSHKVPMDAGWYTTNLVQEVVQSTLDIKSTLDLPWQNKYNGNEYLVAWAQPYGDLTEPWQTQMRTILRTNNYLVDRRATPYQAGFSAWVPGDGLYARTKSSADASSSSTNLNARFDLDYQAGNIYHVFSHPWGDLGNVTNGTKWTEHITHIGNRKDCWYVGFDHLYMYHYLQSQVSLSMELLTNSNDELVYNVSVPSAEREKYGLSYPITYKVTVPTNWSTAKVLYSDADTPSGVVMAEKTTNDFFNGENVYRNDLANHVIYVSQAFPQQYDDFQIKVINITSMSSQDTDGDGFDDEFEILNGMDRFKDQSVIISYIRSHHQRFGLYSEEEIGNVCVGALTIKATEGQVCIRLQMEESTDLTEWIPSGEAVEWTSVTNIGKKFFRVKGGE
jgi:hypothetical protein